MKNVIPIWRVKIGTHVSDKKDWKDCGVKFTVFQQKEIMQRLCEMFGCKYFVATNMPEQRIAEADLELEAVIINDKEKTRDELVSAVMHEICHILAKRSRKYKSFHCIPFDKMTVSDVYNYKKTAVNAETYVDTWAEKLTKMYFPDVVYERSYRTKKEKERCREKINECVVDMLACFGIYNKNTLNSFEECEIKKCVKTRGMK
jgi:hypothetical protein